MIPRKCRHLGRDREYVSSGKGPILCETLCVTSEPAKEDGDVRHTVFQTFETRLQNTRIRPATLEPKEGHVPLGRCHGHLRSRATSLEVELREYGAGRGRGVFFVGERAFPCSPRSTMKGGGIGSASAARRNAGWAARSADGGKGVLRGIFSLSLSVISLRYARRSTVRTRTTHLL